MLGKITILFLAFVGPAASYRCSEPSFGTNSPLGNDSFIFGIGDRATVTTTVLCNSSYYGGRIYTYWTTQHSTNYLGRFYVGFGSGSGSFIKYIQELPDVNVSWSYRSYELKVETTFDNISGSANGSTVSIEDYYRTYKSPSITVICCDEVPSDLKLQAKYNGSNCFHESYAECKDGSAFNLGTGDYMPSVKLECRSMKWTGEYQCLESCRTPKTKFVASVSSEKYRIGSKQEINCSRGKMYEINPPRRFVENVEILCKAGGMWKYSFPVDCWEGTIIDFASKNVTVRAGVSVVFLCEVDSHLRSMMVVADDHFFSESAAWANISMTPDHNDITVACHGTNDLNRTVLEKKTYLNVLYEPELTDDVETIHQFELYTSGHVVISLRSNPHLKLSNINVSKEDEALSNYYLEIDGFNHKIVLDFEQVTEDDFGDYVIEVTSPISDSSLVFEIMVVPASKEQLQSTVPNAGTILAILLAGLLLGSIAVNVFFLRKKQSSVTEKKITGADETSEDCTINDYQEIDVTDEVRYQGSNTASGYANIFMSPSTQSDEKRLATNNELTGPQRQEMVHGKAGRIVPSPNNDEESAYDI